MATIKEYFRLTNEYTKTYGEKTLILMQVGSFFEVYGMKDLETGEISGSKIEDFSRACDFAMSNKKSDGFTHDGKDYGIIMAGFPEWSCEKWFERLPANGFTCVIIRQHKVGSKVIREKDIILSPGTLFTTNESQLTNNIMSIMFYKRPISQLNSMEKIMIAISIVDVIHGTNSFQEFEEEYFHNPSTYDLLEKYYSIYQPSEILMIYDGTSMSEKKMGDILSYMGNKTDLVRYIDLSKKEEELSKQANSFEKQVYQHEWIHTIYRSNDVHSFLERTMLGDKFLGLHNHTFLLHYVYMHNKHLVNKIEEPTMLNQHDQMVVANHSYSQLNFLSDNTRSNSSVFNMLNKAKTGMGRRYCKRILTNPTTNKKSLRKDYDILNKMFYFIA